MGEARSPVTGSTGVLSGHHCSLVQTYARSTSNCASQHATARDQVPVGPVLESIGYRVVPRSSCDGKVRVYPLSHWGCNYTIVHFRPVPSGPYTSYSLTFAGSKWKCRGGSPSDQLDNTHRGLLPPLPLPTFRFWLLQTVYHQILRTTQILSQCM